MRHQYEIVDDIVIISVLRMDRNLKSFVKHKVLISVDKLDKVIKYVDRLHIVRPKQNRTAYVIVKLKNGTTQFFHRFLLNCPTDKVIDHLNFNGLDNRNCNIRICSGKENLQHQRRYSKNKSGYKNVYPLQNGRFKAAKTLNGEVHYIGTYDTADEAHEAVKNFLKSN